ncbi:MAG: chaperone modulator CbpM [Legionella sp.]
MTKENVLVAVVIEESATVSFTEACARYHISEQLLMDMIEEGLFSIQGQKNDALDQQALRRIESAFRLHKDLDINLPGVALALDLLDKIDTMEHELDILRKHF